MASASGGCSCPDLPEHDSSFSANLGRDREPCSTPTLRVIRILLVCTANVCRSPMAEAILAGLLIRRGIVAEVVSAGLLEAGRPMAPEALQAVAGDNPAISGHVSRTLTAEEVSEADLVLGMTREHVREVVVLVPDAWGCTFTLKELVRRGAVHGRRGAHQSLRSWLADVSRDRQRSDLLGAAAVDDVADPMGGTPARFAETAAELRDLCRQLVNLLGA